MAAFRDQLGDRHAGHRAGGKPAGDAALAALDEAIESTKPVDSPWLGLLPYPSGRALPVTEAFTHITASDIAQYYAPPGSTGAPGQPELLTEVIAHLDQPQTAVRVSPAGGAVAVTSYSVDYLRGR